MFNREYHVRATRQGIKSFLAQELYRPAKLPKPRQPRRRKPPGPEQLTLNFEEQLPLNFNAVAEDPDCPLKDIFPEAYEG
jgi:hypothetical protein